MTCDWCSETAAYKLLTPWTDVFGLRRQHLNFACAPCAAGHEGERVPITPRRVGWYAD